MRRARLRVFLLVSALALSAAASPPVPIDGVAAIVDDVTIFRSDVASRLRRLESTFSKDPRERRKEMAELTKVLVGRLVDETLIAKDAAKLHLEVSDAEVSSAMDSVAAANKMDRKQLASEVASAGYAKTEYQDEIRRQILEQKWLVARAVRQIDRRKVSDPVAFELAIEKARKMLIVELREHAYVEIR